MERRPRLACRLVSASAIVLGAIFLMAGCGSLGGALSSAMGQAEAAKVQPAASAPAQQGAQQPAPASAAATPSPAQSQPQAGSAPPAGAVAAGYQYQFNALNSGMLGMGWSGSGGSNYAPGQGAVWAISGSGSSSNSTTFERALLKVNPDSSQWWRLRMDSGKSHILYEYLVGPDSVVQRVRYKDPGTGAIGEFVPDQTQAQPTRAQYDMPKSRADMAKYLVGKEELQVEGGSFTTDHYLINEAEGQGTVEMWTSDKVPGYTVKAVFKSKADGKTSTEELEQIESGVTTALASY